MHPTECRRRIIMKKETMMLLAMPEMLMASMALII
jgi:hypothetical protein